jgi:hypothetical protein
MTGAPVVASPDDTVVLELAGVKEPECGLSGLAGTIDLGRLESTGQRSFSFSVTCNAPYIYAVASKNGGLTLLDQEPPSRIPYTITAEIGSLTASAVCDAPAASAGCVITAAPESETAQTAEVTISWRLGAAAAAGVYQDELIFTVEPQP